MSRSLRRAAVLAVAALLGLGATLPLAAESAAAAVVWSDVPGAQPSDLIVTPISAGQTQTAGFSYTARPSGIADYCAATDPASAWPCPTVDYHDYFTLGSATVTALHQAVITLTPTHAPNGQNWISITSSMTDHWEQVFSATSHGWLYYPEIIGGQQVGQLSSWQVVCTIGVPCTVNFSLNDDYGRFTGDQFLAAQVGGAQIFIPLHPVVTATPPTAAFAAARSGATHEWSFDGSASTAAAGQTVASYRWTYGDGSSETTTMPTAHHTYADGSPHTASLIVVDSAGTSSASVSHTLTEPALIVNSTGDAPATDPAHGCDTGGTVGTPAVPECTLRAAIQSLDAGVGGTRIAFALPAGSTTIAAASALPEITKAGATIDGTETSGMPTISGSALHVKNAAGVTLTKISVVASGDFGVYFEDSAGATVTSSSIGVSPAGVVGAPRFGVVAASSGVVTIGGQGVGNVIEGTVQAVAVAPTGPITSLVVQDNSIGELGDGTLLSGSGPLGLVVFSGSDVPVAGTVISGNKIAGFTTNLSLAGAGVVSPRLTGNRIGVAADQDSLLGAARVNLRLDGVPGAVVTGNQIAGASSDVLVSGNVQVSVQDAGNGLVSIGYHYPGDVGLGAPLPGPLLGSGDTISNNRIGTVTRHSSANGGEGIDVWNAADNTTISGNTVLNHDDKEIWVSGSGARLVVSGNTIGASSADSVSLYTGMKISGVPAPTVSQNSVGGMFTGIDIDADVVGAVVTGNTVGFGANGVTALPIGDSGISVSGPNATIGPDNTVGNSARAGISVSGAHARVFANRVGAAKFGSTAAPNLVGIAVGSHATGAVIGGAGRGNTIVGNGTGLQLLAAGADVGNNTFGAITSSPLGNGTAIEARASASMHDNTIANSTTRAVTVTSPAVVSMLHNAISGTAGGLGVAGAPAAPTVLAADLVTHGASARTFLVLRDVPTAAGTIEVFGNSTCADPEGRVPLFSTPTTGESIRVLSVADRTDLAGLTVMVTVAGSTSTFSNCVTSTVGQDTDGDGIPDVVEGAYPGANLLAGSGKSAAFVADNQKWVVLLTDTGTLQNVSPLDDPDPSGHPGAEFPLGLIDWTVTGIDPGSSARVVFTLPGSVINGWWKYSPHHSPAFFDYSYSPIAGYGGAETAANLPIFGLSTNVVVIVPDGGVGDDDALENGAVRDPSAPAVVPGAAALPPAALAAPRARALASTGTDPADGVAGAFLALLAGLVIVTARILSRRQSHRQAEAGRTSGT
jgi:parallel beta-helix repeat protein